MIRFDHRTALALILCATLVACAPQWPRFTVSNRSFDVDSALALCESAKGNDVADIPTSETRRLRHEALTRLRASSEDGDEAARLITQAIPETSGVPVLVERARYGSVSALLIVEMTGRPSGRLDRKRLWVISDSGDVLLTGMR